MRSRCCHSVRWAVAAAAGVLALAPARGAPADAASDILRRVDAVMFPENATFRMQMTARRADGTEKVYRMTSYKRGRSDVRSEFDFPPVEKGRVLLRKGDQLWMSLPTTRKPVRLSARQSLMGGDFDNTDVMRLNMLDDYAAALSTATDERQWVLDLRARDRSQSYDRILMFVDRATGMPTRQELYTLSGRKIKELVFSDVKDFHGHRRPARMQMFNLLTGSSSTTLEILDMQAGKTLPPSQFVVDALAQ